MKYLEIGNENGGPAYHARWELFYKAIKAKYPEMQLIATSGAATPPSKCRRSSTNITTTTPSFFNGAGA